MLINLIRGLTTVFAPNVVVLVFLLQPARRFFDKTLKWLWTTAIGIAVANILFQPAPAIIISLVATAILLSWMIKDPDNEPTEEFFQLCRFHGLVIVIVNLVGVITSFMVYDKPGPWWHALIYVSCAALGCAGWFGRDTYEWAISVNEYSLGFFGDLKYALLEAIKRFAEAFQESRESR